MSAAVTQAIGTFVTKLGPRRPRNSGGFGASADRGLARGAIRPAWKVPESFHHQIWMLTTAPSTSYYTIIAFSNSVLLHVLHHLKSPLYHQSQQSSRDQALALKVGFFPDRSAFPRCKYGEERASAKQERGEQRGLVQGAMPTVFKHDDALDQDEARESLLSPDTTDGAADLNPGKVRPSPSPSRMSLRPVVSIPRRQSALYKAVEGESRSPRTPNRVRFDIEDESGEEEEGTYDTNGHAGNGHAPRPNGHIRRPSDDGSDGGDAEREESELRRGRVPLLTNVEAPAVTLASDWDEDFNAEDYLETARPKSGLRSAFLNMANSIM